MNNLSLIIAVLVAVVVGSLCLKLLVKYWPRTGGIGINLSKVSCPECGEEMPKKRKPINMRQTLWGGWTCTKCNAEMDKYGAKVNS